MDTICKQNKAFLFYVFSTSLFGAHYAYLLGNEKYKQEEQNLSLEPLSKKQIFYKKYIKYYLTMFKWLFVGAVIGPVLPPFFVFVRLARSF